MKRFDSARCRPRALLRSAALLALLASTTIAAAPSQRLAPVATGFGRDGDLMGTSTAILGDTLVAGSPHAQPMPGISSGAAQVFRNGASGWQREAVLVPDPRRSEQGFGAVALGEDVVAVGASGAGSAETFVFRRSGTTWSQTDDLTFGAVPAISGTRLAIGGASAVRIYEDQSGTWVAEPDLPFDNAAPDERASIVSLAGDTLGVMTHTSGFGSGEAVAVYLFTRVDGVWVRDTKLDLGTAFPDVAPMPAIAVSNGTAVVWDGEAVKVRARGDGGWDVEQALDPGIAWSELGPASVAIDGDRAVVGCDGYFADTQGSAVVFEKSGGVWSRVSRPYDVGGTATDQFGASVALSGDRLAVGAPAAIGDGVRSGKVVPFVVDGAAWTADPGLDEGNAQADQSFGSDVAISGSTAFVLQSGGTAASTVHVFEVEGDRWVDRQQLEAPSENLYGTFGIAIAIDGDTAAVGSRGDRVDGTSAFSSVYVYARGADGWQIVRHLEGDLSFGAPLALSGDRLAVGDVDSEGGPGRVILFARSGGTWTEETTIQPDDSAPRDYFGAPLALSGDTLAVGAPLADAGIESRAGAAYVFADVGGTWQQQARLTAPVPFQDRAFGISIAVAGDTLLVGSQRPTGVDDEAAFLFTRTAGTWTYETALSVPNANDIELQPGFAVALSADASVALVGAPMGLADGTRAGTAWIYRRDGDAWSSPSMLHGLAYPDGIDLFGGVVAISGSDAIIGAPGEAPGGAAYVVPIGETVFANGFD